LYSFFFPSELIHPLFNLCPHSTEASNLLIIFAAFRDGITYDLYDCGLC